jgi:hypothetical protein
VGLKINMIFHLMDSSETKQKRGRKAKSSIIPLVKVNSTNTTPVIVHLPINYSDVNEQSVPIKSDRGEINTLLKKIDDLNERLKKYEKIQKPCINVIDKMSSKCWWCRHSFSTPTVELPEHYFNNTYSSTGVFCSYNCALAFNIDLNDENIAKRTSLLHLHYKQTYLSECIIVSAPSWKILQDYGGTITIDEYRDNFISNKTNYMYIKPPNISRISYVEKVPIISDIPIINNDYVLKRSKPLNSSKYSLESMMEFKKTPESKPVQI